MPAGLYQTAEASLACPMKASAIPMADALSSMSRKPTAKDYGDRMHKRSMVAASHWINRFTDSLRKTLDANGHYYGTTEGARFIRENDERAFRAVRIYRSIAVIR
jgi:hypothetical protein